MKAQVIEIVTNKQQLFVVENESVALLTEKKLEKYIPNFSDMTLEAREKHFKKWLKSEQESSAQFKRQKRKRR